MNKEKKKERFRKILIQAMKIAVGSCAAILVAQAMNLEFATSSGIITLLTILTTKWETLRLSWFRVMTFLVSAVFSGIIFTLIQIPWLAFGLFIFMVVLFSELIGWRATISVNAVIGTHFLTTHDFSFAAVTNEFLLVVIGISIAIMLNLFQNNSSMKNKLIQNIKHVENQLQTIVGELSAYLHHEKTERSVWDDIIALEKRLELILDQAFEYENNTFSKHTTYYIHYFEMRLKQLGVLHNLHYEMKKVRNLPKQAKIVAEYIDYLKPYVEEMNDPAEQIGELERLSEDMKQEPLPVSREEFEGRAMLYHILMDLEEFLIYKRRFVEELDENQLQVYWNEERGKMI